MGSPAQDSIRRVLCLRYIDPTCHESTKGHLISERMCEGIDFQNCNENIARISAVVYKNFQGRNPTNIFVVILENQCLQKFVLRLSDLYQVTMGSKLLLNSLIHKNRLPDVSTSDYSYSKV